MTTKQEIIEILKTEFPTLRLGDDEAGYTQLSESEYNAQIEEWAEVRLAKLNKQIQTEAEAQAKDQAKAELLERLGITADEAKLLIA
jgi:hypothetical protein